MVTVQDVKERWEQIQNGDERILFIVGGPGSGKSLLIRELSEQKGWKYLEAKQLIEEEFLLVPRDERPKLAEDVIRRALSRSDTEVLLLDGINVLFAPILNLNPLELLKTISKTYPIVVGWRGHLEGDQLYLEHNNDPKHAVVTIGYVLLIVFNSSRGFKFKIGANNTLIPSMRTTSVSLRLNARRITSSASFGLSSRGTNKNSSSISCFASKYFQPFCSDNSRINKLLPEPGPPTTNNIRSSLF